VIYQQADNVIINVNLTSRPTHAPARVRRDLWFATAERSMCTCFHLPLQILPTIALTSLCHDNYSETGGDFSTY